MRTTKRPKMIGVYLSDDERKMLDWLVEESGTNISTVFRLLIRQAIQEHTIQLPHKKQEKQPVELV